MNGSCWGTKHLSWSDLRIRVNAFLLHVFLLLSISWNYPNAVNTGQCHLYVNGRLELHCNTIWPVLVEWVLLHERHVKLLLDKSVMVSPALARILSHVSILANSGKHRQKKVSSILQYLQVLIKVHKVVVWYSIRSAFWILITHQWNDLQPRDVVNTTLSILQRCRIVDSLFAVAYLYSNCSKAVHQEEFQSQG